MSTLQDFESVLNEVVQAKRLSQSKVTKLTEIAMQLMDQDTQLVSTLYRTHKSLPAACKISSLYVFDALARAARHQVSKHNLSDRHPGNCATFIMKMAGILEGLFQDMLASGIPEAKEKTKKIYDIWVKGNTFSSTILHRLSDIVTEKPKALEVTTSVTTDPRITSQASPSVLSPQTSTSVSTPVTDAQSSLLALLARAADQKVSQTPINTATASNTPLDAAQLAVLQYLQLASTHNSLSPQTPSSIPAAVPDTQVTQSSAEASVPKSPSLPHDNSVPTEQGKRRDGYQSPSQSDRPYNRNQEHRSYSRDERRDNSRRRGRWNRWDERDRDRDRHRDLAKDRSPRRKDSSRSRSPVDSRFRRRISPPYSHSSQHSSDASWTRNDGNEAEGPPYHDAGKDEFGRNLRLSSPSAKVSDPRGADISRATSIPTGPKKDSLTISTSNDPMSRSSIAYTSSKEPVASVTSTESITESSQAGLNNFDFSKFDFTSASSWEEVAKLWQAAHGYLPSTEEIMQFVMMGAMSQQVSSMSWGNGASDSQGVNGIGNDSFPQGGGRHSGGFYGNIRNAQQGWTGQEDQSTDAVVLGGEGSDKGVSGHTSGDDQQHSATGHSGGRMHKVGDKWVFVRNDSGSI